MIRSIFNEFPTISNAQIYTNQNNSLTRADKKDCLISVQQTQPFKDFIIVNIFMCLYFCWEYGEEILESPWLGRVSLDVVSIKVFCVHLKCNMYFKMITFVFRTQCTYSKSQHNFMS